MLGEFNDWDSFSKAGLIPPGSRRLRRAQASEDRAGLLSEVKSFCQKNFSRMTVETLSCLYERIQEWQGIRMPLADFEKEFARFSTSTIKGTPKHATVSISLWGLQFEFPEDHFAKDIRHAYTIVDNTSKELQQLRSLTQQIARSRKLEISKILKKNKFAKRVLVVQSFCLIECYLNGIAWDYLNNNPDLQSLSARKRKLLEDKSATFHDKLIKYQYIVFQERIIEEDSEPIMFILDVMKPFRDAMMHPSPFSHPSDFGGVGKLERIYNITDDDARRAADTAFQLVGELELKRCGEVPSWAKE